MAQLMASLLTISQFWGLMRLRPTHTHSCASLSIFPPPLLALLPNEHVHIFNLKRKNNIQYCFFGKQYYILRGYPTPAFQTEFPKKIVEMVPFTFSGGREYLSFWLEGGSSSPLFRSTWAFWCSVVTLIWGKLHRCTGYLTVFGLSGHQCSA